MKLIQPYPLGMQLLHHALFILCPFFSYEAYPRGATPDPGGGRDTQCSRRNIVVAIYHDSVGGAVL